MQNYKKKSPVIHCQCIEEDDMDYHDMNYDSDGYYQNYWP